MLTAQTRGGNKSPTKMMLSADTIATHCLSWGFTAAVCAACNCLDAWLSTMFHLTDCNQASLFFLYPILMKDTQRPTFKWCITTAYRALISSLLIIPFELFPLIFLLCPIFSTKHLVVQCSLPLQNLLQSLSSIRNFCSRAQWFWNLSPFKCFFNFHHISHFMHVLPFGSCQLKSQPSDWVTGL